MSDNNQKFEYSYSSLSESEKNEVEFIQKKYSETKAEKTNQEKLLAELKTLDKKVDQSGVMVSIICGLAGTLIFGLGMTFCLEWSNYPAGILISAAGAVFIALAYPLYEFIHKKTRKKYGNRILELSNQLLKEKNKTE